MKRGATTARSPQEPTPYTTLARCKPGTRFTINGRTGVLISINDCRAYVRWDGESRVIDFVAADRAKGSDATQKRVAFVSTGECLSNIAPGTEVEVLP